MAHMLIGLWPLQDPQMCFCGQLEPRLPLSWLNLKQVSSSWHSFWPTLPLNFDETKLPTLPLISKGTFLCIYMVITVTARAPGNRFISTLSNCNQSTIVLVLASLAPVFEIIHSNTILVKHVVTVINKCLMASNTNILNN